MADTVGSVTQKRDYYLQILQKAQKLDDQMLIKLILKKLIRLGMTGVSSATSGCIIIPFPTIHCSTKFKEYERFDWWTLVKLTLAVPGSLATLFLLALYRSVPMTW
ncbi:MAG: hypothetical protein KJO61_13480 [Deltaproteobacteria bacterium]|nr:hypothetical protein [Deltaproteobacteria bacterium]